MFCLILLMLVCRILAQDTEPPVLSCPSSQVVPTDPGLMTAVVTWSPALPHATDNSGTAPAVTLHEGLASGAAFPYVPRALEPSPVATKFSKSCLLHNVCPFCPVLE